MQSTTVTEVFTVTSSSLVSIIKVSSCRQTRERGYSAFVVCFFFEQTIIYYELTACMEP